MNKQTIEQKLKKLLICNKWGHKWNYTNHRCLRCGEWNNGIMEETKLKKKIEKFWIPLTDPQDNESIMDILIDIQEKFNEIIDVLNNGKDEK